MAKETNSCFFELYNFNYNLFKQWQENSNIYQFRRENGKDNIHSNTPNPQASFRKNLGKIFIYLFI